MVALVPVLIVPPQMITVPLPSSVVVGYQRACDIIGPSVQALDAGSKMVVLITPWVGLRAPCQIWPPAMNTRPSDSTVVPEQKTSR